MNCQINQASCSTDYELMGSARCSVEPASSKTFELPPGTGESYDTAAVLAKLCDSLELVVNQQTTLTVKVLSVKNRVPCRQKMARNYRNKTA